jgi:PAS domain S-box-containing protein
MRQEIKILFLEDVATDVELNLLELKKAGFDVISKVAETKADFIQGIDEFKPDIILADYNLPSFDGMEALDYIMNNEIKIPFIFVSGSMGEEWAVDTLKRGATDYVLKQNIVKLAPSVRRALDEIDLRKKREEAEESVRNSEFKYRTLMENIPDIIAQFDSDLRFIYVNQAITKITGLPPDAYLGKTNEELGMPAKNTAVWNSEMRQIFQTSEPRAFELDIRSPKSVRYLSFLSAPEFSDDGTVKSILTIARDITERKQSEAALRESEERYRIVADFTFDWEYWQAPDGKFIYVSPSCERVTGYTADEFYNDPELRSRLVPSDDSERLAAHIHTYGKSPDEPEQHNLDFRILTRNGEERWIAHSCQRVYGLDGQYLGRRASNRDITKRKRAEEALKEKIGELELFNNLMIGRELKMVDLKKEINELLIRLGEKEKYRIVEKGSSKCL